MTDDTGTPIIVNESALPGALASALRQILLVVGGWAVGKGFLDNDTLTAILTVTMIIAPLIYGQIKGVRKHRELVTTAKVAPNDIAQVKS